MKRRKVRLKGPMQEPTTPLLVKCPQCDGVQSYIDESGDYHKCICRDGYVETGYTQERCDKMQGRIDALLVMLAHVQDMLDAPGERISSLDEFVADNAEEIEVARSRTG